MSFSHYFARFPTIPTCLPALRSSCLWCCPRKLRWCVRLDLCVPLRDCKWLREYMFLQAISRRGILLLCDWQRNIFPCPERRPVHIDLTATADCSGKTPSFSFAVTLDPYTDMLGRSIRFSRLDIWEGILGDLIWELKHGGGVTYQLPTISALATEWEHFWWMQQPSVVSPEI